MRTWLSCVVVAVSSSCVVPRSMTLGQMAGPVGRGATDVSVFAGVQYASQLNPQFTSQDSIGDPIKTEERSAALSAPNFEANLGYGFSDHVSLNVHGSSAGIQPGIKFTVNKSKVAHFAVMPQVAFGYASLGQSTYFAPSNENVLTERNPSSGTSFTFLGGLKLLFSHNSGFYMGVGYDFLFNRNFNRKIVGGANTQDTVELINSTTGHQVSASIGLEIKLGWVRLRPEIAFAVMPGIGQSITTRTGPNETTVGASGGFGWAIFPGFSIGVASPVRALTSDEEEEEAAKAQQEKREKRRRGEDADEDDDDDETGRPPPAKKAVDDDDEDRPKAKKRRQFEDTQDED